MSPSRMVPGILPSDEKMLQARLFSYPDAQRYRLGVNNHLIPINAPRCPFQQAQVDGFMNVLETNSPINYFPSLYSQFTEAPAQPNPVSQPNLKESGFKIRSPITKFNDYTQPALRYNSFDPARQDRFAMRIAATLTTEGLSPSLQATMLQRWYNVSDSLGDKIKQYINQYEDSQDFEQIQLMDATSLKMRRHRMTPFEKFRSSVLIGSGKF